IPADDRLQLVQPGAQLRDQRCIVPQLFGLSLHDRPQPGDLGFKLLPLRIEHTRVLPPCPRTVVDFRAGRANSYQSERVPEWLLLGRGAGRGWSNLIGQSGCFGAVAGGHGSEEGSPWRPGRNPAETLRGRGRSTRGSMPVGRVREGSRQGETRGTREGRWNR